MNNNDYDAFAIFDADNIVDPNFLKEMNNALSKVTEFIKQYG